MAGRLYEDMFTVYIIQSDQDESYYIGQTKDLNDRLKRHNTGQCRYTRNKRPYKIAYFEEYVTRSEAVRREIQIKSYKGGNEFKKLIQV